MKIRKATESDLPRIIEMAKSTYSDNDLGSVMTEYDRDSMSEFWGAVALGGSGVILVAEDENGKIVGESGIVIYPWPQGKKCMVAQGVSFTVDKDHRGNGVGRALLDASVVWAREHGATIVTIASLKTSQDTAQMCVRNGFKLLESSYFKRL